MSHHKCCAFVGKRSTTRSKILDPFPSLPLLFVLFSASSFSSSSSSSSFSSIGCLALSTEERGANRNWLPTHDESVQFRHETLSRNTLSYHVPLRYCTSGTANTVLSIKVLCSCILIQLQYSTTRNSNKTSRRRILDYLGNHAAPIRRPDAPTRHGSILFE